ncbi:hypothetical protein Tco_0328543 [Tanacetum coccineum]
MTSIGNMVGQIMQKEEEERRIAEDQAAKDRYWKIPICYDDDEDYTIAITPVLLTEEPVDSLIMEDEHLDTILTTESDEVIMSSVEELVLIQEESRIVVNSNDDDTSSDDVNFEDIEYVEASPPDLEIVRFMRMYKGLKTKQKRPRDTTQVVTRDTTNDLYEVAGTRYCSYEVAGNVRWQYEVAAVGQSEHDTCPKRVIRGCQACVSPRLSCGDPRQ